MKHWETDVHRLSITGCHGIAIGFAGGKITMCGGGFEMMLVIGSWVFRLTRWNNVPGQRVTPWPPF